MLPASLSLTRNGKSIILKGRFRGALKSAMKIAVDQITESVKELRFTEGPENLNEIFAKEKNDDFHFNTFLNVDMAYYRSGQELFFRGSLASVVEGRCSRCLRKYTFPLENEFAFVLTPGPSAVKRGEVSAEDMGMSFYNTDDIDLSPFVREQVLLALPTRPLCDDHCRGLCARCGANLNEESCLCSSPTLDPRMDVFRTLKLAR